MPLGDLESELQKMAEKIPPEQQNQKSVNPILSSLSAMIRDIASIRLEFGNRDRLTDESSEPPSANFESGESESDEMEGASSDDVAPGIGKELNKQSVNFECGERSETEEMEAENSDDAAPDIGKELNKLFLNFESGEQSETEEMEGETSDDAAPDIGKELNTQSVNFESGERSETVEMEGENSDDAASDIGKELNKQDVEFFTSF